MSGCEQASHSHPPATRIRRRRRPQQRTGNARSVRCLSVWCSCSVRHRVNDPRSTERGSSAGGLSSPLAQVDDETDATESQGEALPWPWTPAAGNGKATPSRSPSTGPGCSNTAAGPGGADTGPVRRGGTGRQLSAGTRRYRGRGRGDAGPGSYDALAVALAFGLTLAALAVALGPLSGCHLNPAVTLGLTVARRFPVRSVPAYLLAQAGGAVLASLTVWARLGCPGPFGSAPGGAPARRRPGSGPHRPGRGGDHVRAGAGGDGCSNRPAGTAGRRRTRGGFRVVRSRRDRRAADRRGGQPGPGAGPDAGRRPVPDVGVYLLAPIAGGLLAAAGCTRVLAPAHPPRA